MLHTSHSIFSKAQVLLERQLHRCSGDTVQAGWGTVVHTNEDESQRHHLAFHLLLPWNV